MYASRRRLLAAVAGLTMIGCAPLSGCVAQTTTTAAPGDLAGRVIIKFKDPSAPVNAAPMLADLERTCGVRVNYARALGAGAHLYELSGLRDQSALEQAVKNLAARPDVQFAEIDRLMKPLQPKANEANEASKANKANKAKQQ
jgi:hypothetical protein